MRVCVFGAGAIGGLVAARLAQVPEISVSVVARGEQLQAIRDRGIRVISPKGNIQVSVNATDDARTLGPQDVVFIALKQHQVTAALQSIESLLGPKTMVVPPTTGIPYWYFHGLQGPWCNRQIEKVDPGGLQWSTLGPQRAIGCVYWAAAEVIEPGVVHHDGRLLRFPIGEPDGSRSERIVRLAQAMNDAGLNAAISEDVRADIWAKIISSLCWNPLAVLTGATLDAMCHDAGVLQLVRRLMREAEEIAEALGVKKWPLSLEQRIEAAQNSGAHRTSMLQDWEKGRPLEIDVLTDSIGATRELANVRTPTIDEVYALLRLKVLSASTSTGLATMAKSAMPKG